MLVALDGRSDRTRGLAHAAGLADVHTLEAVLADASVVLSVVPPGSAAEVAAAVARAAGDSRPLVVDLNAVAPATVQRVAALLAERGIETVDGSISGPPPQRPGTTRIYLSGSRAAEVAALPLEGVERIVVGDDIGLASAVKMCTASVYKGRVALLAQAFRVAHAYGVTDHVLDDLAGTGIVTHERSGATLGKASAKAWRYVAEMEEIAATQGDAGLTPELFRAVALVYADLADRAPAAAPEDVPEDLPLQDVLARFSVEAATRGGAEAR